MRKRWVDEALYAALGLALSTALHRLVICAFAFLIRSPTVSLVGTAALTANATAF